METVLYEKYRNHLGLRNKIGRLCWNLTYLIAFRPVVLPQFNRWRIFLLRLFGARIGAGCKIHASAKVWAPWNLEVGQRTAIGPGATCYNPGKIVLGNKVTISQGAHLCAASHDYTKKEHPLITGTIEVKDFAWVAAEAFISMGVTVGEGAIIAARGCTVKDVEAWTIVGGNPARFIKKRVMVD